MDPIAESISLNSTMTYRLEALETALVEYAVKYGLTDSAKAALALSGPGEANYKRQEGKGSLRLVQNSVGETPNEK